MEKINESFEEIKEKFKNSQKFLRILDLFSGTKSWEKPYEGLQNVEIISLDNNTDLESNATIQEDILEWMYKIYPPKFFDVIYASPPCGLYFTNRKQKTGTCVYTEKDKRLSLKLVRKTIEIIDYFKPKFWIIENPRAKMRKHFPKIFGVEPKTFYYCMWGFDYKKPTDIWSNLNNEIESPKCIHKKHKLRIHELKYDKIHHWSIKVVSGQIAPELTKEFAKIIMWKTLNE